MMKNFYELTYIINPVLDENEIKGEISKVEALIKDNDGEIEETEEWGIRRLAYEIDHKNSGYYVNLYMNAPGSLLIKLERYFNISDNVFRYLTLKYDNKMLKARDLKKNGYVPSVLKIIEEPQEETKKGV